MSRRTDKNIGIIGLGIIGQRVADSLRRRGFHVFVWNRTPRPFPNFVGSPAEIAQLCDFVQIFVADDEALLQMVQQMKQALKGHHVVMAHCTVAPATMRAAAEIVQRRGARFLDAPFTGSRMAAEKGELVYYVAGDEAAFRRARPVLEASSKEIIEIGEIGQATTIKLATNMITAATAQVAAEALALVHASGVPIEKFAEAMRGNASSSGTLSMKLPKMIEGDFEPHFSVKHMLKDVQIVSRLARSHGLFFGATEAARDSLIVEVREGRSDYDYSSVVHTFFPEGSRQEGEGSTATDEQPTLAGLDDRPTEQLPAEVPAESEQTGGDIRETAEVPDDVPDVPSSDATGAEGATGADAVPEGLSATAAVEVAEGNEFAKIEGEPERHAGEPELSEKTEVGPGAGLAPAQAGNEPEQRDDELHKREGAPDAPAYLIAAEPQQRVAEFAPRESVSENLGQELEQREGQPEERGTDPTPSVVESTGQGDGSEVLGSDLAPRDTTPELRHTEPDRRIDQPESREPVPPPIAAEPEPSIHEAPPEIAPESRAQVPDHREGQPEAHVANPELRETEQPPSGPEPEQSFGELPPPQIAPENQEGKPEEPGAEPAKPANDSGTRDSDLESPETAPDQRAAVPAQYEKEPGKPKEPAQTSAASELGEPTAGDEKRPGFFRRLFTFDY